MGKRITLFLIAIASIFGCEKDKAFGPVYLDQTNSVQTTKANRLLVGCEGNFQLSNASLYAIDLDNGLVDAGVYQSSNDNPIGDVLQSIYQLGDTIVTVINNSGVIRLLNDSTYEEIGTIEGLISPRYAMKVDDKLWVTDLYSNQINIIDLSSLTIQKTIPIDGWTERMVIYNNQVLVANITESSVSIFDYQGNKMSDLDLDYEPTFMFTINKELIIAGNNSEDNLGRISKYNTSLYRIEHVQLRKNISVAAQGDDNLFTISNKTLSKRSISDFEVKSEAGLDVVTPYGMIISASREMIYVSDAKDYISSGEVLAVSASNLNIENRYSVGNIPQSMLITLE